LGSVFVVDRNGVEHELPAEPGKKVMEIIRDAGLPIEALCGGCCACSTCHVYVDEEWLPKLAPAQADEIETLGLAFEVRDTSRLSCQLPYTPELDGMRMTLGAE
jgi:2Fe-2S ferredoxin